jgi:uncharacterized membrane protein YgaE (UPF0421/DUF939 family)
MSGDLVRNSLRLALATFLTAAIALWFERILFVWYPLIAVVVTIDDSDEQTIKAVMARMLGTILGGLVTFAVHCVLDGWIGVLVSLLLMLPLLRLLGWEAATGTATLISIMFLMVPRYSALNWGYVFNRGLDTAVGCLIAIVVGLLFWPNDTSKRLHQEELALKAMLREQLHRYQGWLRDGADRPEPIQPAPFSASVQQLETLVDEEQHGPRRARLRHHRWPERLALWRGVRHHWLALERLLAALPARLPPSQGAVADGPLWWLITSLEPALEPLVPSRPGSEPAAKHADLAVCPGPDRQGGGAAAMESQRPRADWVEKAAVGRALPSQDWLELARSANLPPLLLLAIASEQEAVARGLSALSGIGRC